MDTIKKDNLADRIAKKIRRAILLGQYEENFHLAEPNLAQEFGTSRGPIRDVLQMLIIQGFAERQVNGRVRVRRFTTDDIHNLFEFRYILENHSLMKCENDLNILPSIHRLYEILERMADSWISSLEFSSLDMDFHKEIILMSGNKSLIQSWHGMEDVIKSILEITNQGSPRVEEIVKMHSNIVKEMEKKEWKQAASLLKEHLDIAENYMIHKINLLVK